MRRIAALLAGAFYANGTVWNFPITRYGITWCRLVRDGYFRRPALLSLAATALAILSYIMLRARAPDARPSTETEAGPSEPKRQYPPIGEAVMVPPEHQWPSSSQGHRQAQQRVAGPSWTPYQQVDTPPRRQAQPAVEMVMV